MEDYDFNLVVQLIELNSHITERETLDAVYKILFYIKLYIKTGREYFYLYKKLSEVLNFSKKYKSNNNT